MSIDRYMKWRNNSTPCGRADCGFYEVGDPEAQCCYCERKDGDPGVANCKGYVPDPFYVSQAAREAYRTNGPAKKGAWICRGWREFIRKESTERSANEDVR